MDRWLLEPEGFTPVVGTTLTFAGVDALQDLGWVKAAARLGEVLAS